MTTLLDAAESTAFAEMPDDRLISAEDGLHKMFAVKKAAGLDTVELQSAHTLLARQMFKRGLFYEPLTAEPAPLAPAPETQVRKDIGPHSYFSGCCDFSATDHMAKAVGTDGSLGKALASTTEDRQQGAENGLALPDGCLAAETLVTTLDGPQRIDSLLGPCTVLTDQGWVEAEVRDFGLGTLFEVVLRRGSEERTISATLNHRWVTTDGTFVTTDQLRDVEIPFVDMANFANVITSRPARSTQALASIGGGRAGDASGLLEVREEETGSGVLRPQDCPAQPVSPRLHQMLSQTDDRVRAGESREEWTQCSTGEAQDLRSHRGSVRSIARRSGRGLRSLRTLRTGLDSKTPTSGPFASAWACARALVRLLQSAVGMDRIHRGGSRHRISPWRVVAVAATSRTETVYCAVVPGLQRFVLADGILTGNSFYIPDEAHLHACIRLLDQAPDPQSAMNHIIERAKAMGLESALPPAWRTGDGTPDATDPAISDGAHSIAPGTAPTASGPPRAGATQPAKAKPKPTSALMKAIAKSVVNGEFSEDLFAKAAEEITLDENIPTYFVMKSANTTERYTLGPLYMPNTLDAHGEWASATDLFKARLDYVREGDRTIYLQHSTHPAGEWVDIVQWPQEVRSTMQVMGAGGVKKAEAITFPADTVYLGVVWEPWAHTEVLKGNIQGFSMGGWAHRIEGLPA